MALRVKLGVRHGHDFVAKCWWEFKGVRFGKVLSLVKGKFVSFHNTEECRGGECSYCSIHSYCLVLKVCEH